MAPKPSNGFRWNLNYMTVSRVRPHVQMRVEPRQRGWSRRTLDMSCYGFLDDLSYSWARAQPTPTDRFWRPTRQITCVFPSKDVLFGGLVVGTPHLGVDIPSKTSILGPWTGVLKTNRQILKVSYYRNYCIDSNHILHNDRNYQLVITGGANTRPVNPRWRMAAILENR